MTQFLRDQASDSEEVVTPLMLDGTYLSRNFATLGPLTPTSGLVKPLVKDVSEWPPWADDDTLAQENRLTVWLAGLCALWTIGKKLPQDAINPAHGSLLRVNSPSHKIFSKLILNQEQIWRCNPKKEIDEGVEIDSWYWSHERLYDEESCPL